MHMFLFQMIKGPGVNPYMVVMLMFIFQMLRRLNLSPKARNASSLVTAHNLKLAGHGI